LQVNTTKLIKALEIVTILDWGNNYCKAIVNGGRTKIYPSAIHELSHAELVRTRKLEESSPLIAFNGRSYLVGSKAIERAGSSNWSRNKLSIETLRFGIYSAHSEPAVINQLVICVPDASLDLDFAPLLGEHLYRYNGRAIRLEIKDIQPIDETYGAWLGGQELFKYPDRNNITVTIGGQDINVDCRNGKGEILASKSNRDLGMVSIARRLSDDLKIIHQLNTSPSIDRILDCMARGELVLPGTEINFTVQFEEQILRWKKALGEFVFTSLDSSIVFYEYLFCGAGAGYLKSGGNAIVAPRPQTFAIESLLSLYEN
jgi:Actin like proteins N terminal domain